MRPLGALPTQPRKPAVTAGPGEQFHGAKNQPARSHVPARGALSDAEGGRRSVRNFPANAGPISHPEQRPGVLQVREQGSIQDGRSARLGRPSPDWQTQKAGSSGRYGGRLSGLASRGGLHSRVPSGKAPSCVLTGERPVSYGVGRAEREPASIGTRSRQVTPRSGFRLPAGRPLLRSNGSASRCRGKFRRPGRGFRPCPRPPRMRRAQGVPAAAAGPSPRLASIAGSTGPAPPLVTGLTPTDVPADSGREVAGRACSTRKSFSWQRCFGDIESRCRLRVGERGPCQVCPARSRQARGNRSVETTLRVRMTGGLRPGNWDAPAYENHVRCPGSM